MRNSLVFIILTATLVLFSGCVEVIQTSDGKYAVENVDINTPIEYFEPGVYYYFNFGSEKTLNYEFFTIDSYKSYFYFEDFIELVKNEDMVVLELWYKESRSNCNGLTALVQPSLIVKTDKENSKLEGFNFEKTSEPYVQIGWCANKVKHYTLQE